MSTAKLIDKMVKQLLMMCSNFRLKVAPLQFWKISPIICKNDTLWCKTYHSYIFQIIFIRKKRNVWQPSKNLLFSASIYYIAEINSMKQ